MLHLQALRCGARALVGASTRVFSTTGHWSVDGARTPSPLEMTETKRARLLYQSRKRGILENDLLLGGFADTQLQTLDEDQLAAYDQFINGGFNEWDIYYWITEKAQPPENTVDVEILQMLKDYATKSGKAYWYQKYDTTKKIHNA